MWWGRLFRAGDTHTGLAGWIGVDEEGLPHVAVCCTHVCSGPDRRPGPAGQVAQARVGAPGLRPVRLFHGGPNGSSVCSGHIEGLYTQGLTEVGWTHK